MEIPGGDRGRLVLAVKYVPMPDERRADVRVVSVSDRLLGQRYVIARENRGRRKGRVEDRAVVDVLTAIGPVGLARDRARDRIRRTNPQRQASNQRGNDRVPATPC